MYTRALVEETSRLCGSQPRSLCSLGQRSRILPPWRRSAVVWRLSPTLPLLQGLAAGAAGAWKGGRLSGLRPLGRRRADPLVADIPLMTAVWPNCSTQSHALSAAWCGDRGPDSSSLESVEVSGRLGASLPIWPRCGSVSTPWFGGWPVWCPIWAPHRRGRRGVNARRGEAARQRSRGEAGTGTAGRRPQGVSRRRGEGGESCGVVRLPASTSSSTSVMNWLWPIGSPNRRWATTRWLRRCSSKPAQPAGGPDRIAGLRRGGRRRGRASVVAQGRDQAIDREPRVLEGRARANAAGTHGAFEAWCHDESGTIPLL